MTKLVQDRCEPDDIRWWLNLFSNRTKFREDTPINITDISKERQFPTGEVLHLVYTTLVSLRIFSSYSEIVFSNAFES
ncbi:hypothetical protein D8S78_23040 [Natrialba swarupiae]|nr:hypothetical protein [Natrialba swarupiae]